jgi:hypothetical protein
VVELPVELAHVTRAPANKEQVCIIGHQEVADAIGSPDPLKLRLVRLWQIGNRNSLIRYSRLITDSVSSAKSDPLVEQKNLLGKVAKVPSVSPSSPYAPARKHSAKELLKRRFSRNQSRTRIPRVLG